MGEMKRADSHAHDPWGPISATLYEVGSSDLVENIVRHTGVSVAWPTLDERTGYSHKTRIRAYKPAVEAAYSQLHDDEKRVFVQVVAKRLLQSRIPDSAKGQMIDSLEQIGWSVTEEGILTDVGVTSAPNEVQQRRRISDVEKPQPEEYQAQADSEPTESRHPKAFVSHSTQDHPFVERFARDLRAKGVDAWYSGWEIKPGDSIRAKIEEGLEGCEYFIIVLSKNSINRPWVQTELDAATIRKLNGKVRKIIPVKIEDCGELPPTLSALCWEDFSNQPHEAALKRVLDSIFGVDVRPPLGKPPSTMQDDVPSPTIILRQPKKSSAQTNFPIYDRQLGRFADQLKSEGFDARTDIFNGQLGLIVGPGGLDARRMLHNEAALFFPLWELNCEANRPLVVERRFHDIVEHRPKDWQYNRPHPKGQEGPSESSQPTGAAAKRRYMVEREFTAWRPGNRENPRKHLPMRQGFHIFAVLEARDVFETKLGFTGDELIKFDMDANEYEANRMTLLESVRPCTEEDILPPPY